LHGSAITEQNSRSVDLQLDGNIIKQRAHH
jgi:hypothetical protein